MPFQDQKLIADPAGIYHAATVGWADEVSVNDFEYMAGKHLIWTLVPNVWLSEPQAGHIPDPGIRFPTEQVENLRYHSTNCIPLVRMSPRSRRHDWRYKPEPFYSLRRIAGGDFDVQLTAWGEAAKVFGQPLLVEFGSEMNGYWEPWNATHNGAGEETTETAPDGKRRYLGQKRYRDAHIHIIELFRNLGVKNITWFFHANWNDKPCDQAWNRLAGYYPGDEYIDWISISCYGAEQPGPLRPLKVMLDHAIENIRSFSPAVRDKCQPKPLAIAELGVLDYPEACKAEWIRESYQLLAEKSGPFGPYRKQVKGVSWWNESWWDKPDDNSEPLLRNDGIASSPKAVAAYRKAVSDKSFIEYI